METKCMNCKKPLFEKRGDAKFCSQVCKNKYGYRQRLEGLKGIAELRQKKEKEKQKENGKENQQDSNNNSLIESMRGLVRTNPLPKKEEEPEFSEPSSEESNNNGNNTDNISIDASLFYDPYELDFLGLEEPEQTETFQEPKQEEIKKEEPKPLEIPLPEKYVMKEIKLPNPEYVRKQESMLIYKKHLESLEQEFLALEKRLKDERARNGNDWILKGGLAGGAVGYFTDDEDKSIGRLFLFSMLGAGAGFLGKALTNDSREKDKQEKIKAINRRIDEIREEYNLTLSDLHSAEQSLLLIPETVTETRKEISAFYQFSVFVLEKEKKEQEKVKEQEMQKKEQEQTVVQGVPKEKPVIKEEPKQKFQKPTTPIQQITFKSNKIMKAKDLGNLNYYAIEFKGLWKEFFGNPEVNFSCLIHGNSGEGKSTFCMWFARYLAENFGRVLYVSAEEGLNKTFQDKLKYCEAEVDNFYILDVNSAEEFLNEVDTNEFHFIILDSLHDLSIDAKRMKEIIQKYHNTAFITIDQNNKKGDLLGNNDKKHLHDIVVNVKNYVAETTKNRFKERGMVFKTADFIDSVSSKTSSKNQKPSNPSDDRNKGYDLNDDRQNIV